MSTSMMADAGSDHVIPTMGGATTEPPVPTFLSGARYLDFLNDDNWDSSHRELLLGLYEQKAYPKPPLGPNPFAANNAIATAQALRFDTTRFTSEALSGEVSLRL